MEANTVIHEKDDVIGIITLNRPKNMNAINDQLIRDFSLVIDNIEYDEEVKPIFITRNKTKKRHEGVYRKESTGIQR